MGRRDYFLHGVCRDHWVPTTLRYVALTYGVIRSVSRLYLSTEANERGGFHVRARHLHTERRDEAKRRLTNT